MVFDRLVSQLGFKDTNAKTLHEMLETTTKEKKPLKTRGVFWHLTADSARAKVTVAFMAMVSTSS